MKDIKDLKIFISVDIEGVCGICNWNETEMGEAEYNYFREEMIKETCACCEALIEMGITNITVRDAHDSARNIIPDRLPECVTLIREWTNGPCDMMAGLDSSFDGVILIGYHSAARSTGNPLSHTLTTGLKHIKINGKLVSEFILNTYFAKTEYNVPVIMLSGDDNLTKQVKLENSNIETVSTNTGLHGAIITKHPNIVLKDIKDKTKKAILSLVNGTNFFVNVPSEFETEMQFKNHILAYKASFFPGAKFLNSDKTVHYTKKFLDALIFIMFNE